MQGALVFQTPGRHGYGVQFSPYIPNRIACATSQHYGIAGIGTLFVLDITPSGELVVVMAGDWSQGLFDVTWSENEPNIAVTGSGDGSLQVWDTGRPTAPVKVLKEHTKEVYGVDWNQKRDAHFVLSASWDQTVKMWDITRDQALTTFTGHDNIVYSAIWSPHLARTFASTSGDHTLRVWDVRKPYMAQVVIPAHNAEVLTCDWCKYHPNLLFTGAVDGSVRGWDLRNTRQPVSALNGHRYAVKRVQCSPFEGNIVATCSYDFSVRLWDIQQGKCLDVIEHHTEFVYGLDFNVHVPGQMVDCAWDGTVKVFKHAATSPVEPQAVS